MRSSIAVAASVAAVASAQSLPIPSGVTDVAGVSSAVQQFSSAIAALPSDQQASISALVSSYVSASFPVYSWIHGHIIAVRISIVG